VRLCDIPADESEELFHEGSSQKTPKSKHFFTFTPVLFFLVQKNGLFCFTVVSTVYSRHLRALPPALRAALVLIAVVTITVVAVVAVIAVCPVVAVVAPLVTFAAFFFWPFLLAAGTPPFFALILLAPSAPPPRLGGGLRGGFRKGGISEVVV